MLEFYMYRLAVGDQFSPLHRSGKLFQQYIADGYVKTETSNSSGAIKHYQG